MKSKQVITDIVVWAILAAGFLTIDHFTCNWISGGAKTEIKAIDTTIVENDSIQTKKDSAIKPEEIKVKK